MALFTRTMPMDLGPGSAALRQPRVAPRQDTAEETAEFIVQITCLPGDFMGVFILLFKLPNTFNKLHAHNQCCGPNNNNLLLLSKC